MESLLEKSHSLKSLLKASKDTPDFPNMAQVISQNIQVNVYIIGRRGKILGYHLWDEYSCSNMQQVLYFSERFPESYNQKLISILETEKNITDTENSCIFRHMNVLSLNAMSRSFLSMDGENASQQ